MPHFHSIHYLRGIAAIMVVVFHIFSNVKFMHADLPQISWLRGGVDLFFVISGFVMVQSTAGRIVKPLQFMKQRVLRIVPMYWIATFAVMMQVEGEWLFKVQSLLFLPAMNPDSHVMQPVLEPGWTLNYEMFFYAVFALTLLLKDSLRIPAIAIFFICLTLLGRATEGNQWASFYCRPIILEFVLGMAIARFGLRLPVISVPVGVTAMIVLLPMGIDRFFALGIPAALIVAGALTYEDRLPRWKLADFLGSASYSIYLFHLLALGFVVKFWPDAESDKAMFFIVSFGAAIVTGCGIYWALEKPITALLMRRKQVAGGYSLVRAGQIQ